jgi:hypothetical protein
VSRRTRLLAVTARPEQPAPVQALRPDPLLWEVVLRLADGDLSRVHVVSETEALVHRGPARRGTA